MKKTNYYSRPFPILFPQFRYKLLEDMGMLIDIILRVLDGNRPLVIKSRREEDTTVCQEEPVRV